jgi:hypothetical protein
MAWYVNDLSLCGQYPSATEFLKDLQVLMGLRQQMPLLAQQLFCSKGLDTKVVSSGVDFRRAVQSSGDKNFISLVLSWLTKYGPFWDDVRQSNPDDYFEHKGINVTDQGLGEAARRELVGIKSSSFSFRDAGFDYSPLGVMQGLPEEPITTVYIENIWQFDRLRDGVLNSVPLPVNWRQMVETASAKFDMLTFSPACINSLESEPFSMHVVRRVFDLLEMLQEFMNSRDKSGRYSDRTKEIISQYFSGEDAWFSDESVSNKRNFADQLEFPDFEKPGNKVSCTWHGKINTPKYRIHFEWPAESQSKIRIFYIGPKITKH